MELRLEIGYMAMTDAEKARSFINRQNHMVVAVVLEDGSPWAVPVKIQAKGEWSLEWDSRVDTLHSQAIKRDPRVAITMFEKAEDTQTGLSLACHAEVIERHDDDVARYRATIHRAWITDETFVKREVELR